MHARDKGAIHRKFHRKQKSLATKIVFKFTSPSDLRWWEVGLDATPSLFFFLLIITITKLSNLIGYQLP